MPATIQDFVITLLLIALYTFGHTVYQAFNNGETSSQIINRVKENLYVIISYFAIFFIVYYILTTMTITIPNGPNTQLESRSQAHQKCDLSLWTCNHSLGLATQRNELLEKRVTFHEGYRAAAWSRISKCEAEIWAVGQEKKRGRDGEEGIEHIKV